jgi:hypothetical protein
MEFRTRIKKSNRKHPQLLSPNIYLEFTFTIGPLQADAQAQAQADAQY